MKHLGLSFDIDLRDKITGKVGKVQKQLNGLAYTARKSFLQIKTGAADVRGAATAISSVIDPSRQMQRSLGEVASLGIADTSLKQLNKTSLALSIQFGTDAASVAASAYDIQSSITGLNGNELVSFTKASNILAKGIKADSGTITNYMGTMYGIFKNQANDMGKAAWVEQLAGQTATAVQMFKTTGTEMSSAFTSVGSAATSAGINAPEQMAILGTLQSTMSGSEAGTKYKAFLSGIGSAQEKLGLSFTDSNGNMLGMMDILGKLRGKFGDTFDVAESTALKKAFGSDEAVSMITLLMADMDGLGKSINTLGDIKGMDKATQMAKAMVDPMDRLTQGGNALRIVLGQALLPVITPIADGFADASAAMEPVVNGFANVSAVMKPMNNVLGLGKKAWGAYSRSQWVANRAMWGFPGTWIVGALVALGVGVAAAIYWWDDLKAAFLDSSWGQAVIGLFDQIMGWFRNFGSAVDWVLEKLNFMPGMDVSISGSAAPPSMTSDMVNAPRMLQSSGKGGVVHQIASSTKQTSSTTHIGKVENRFEQKVSVLEAMHMAGA